MAPASGPLDRASATSYMERASVPNGAELSGAERARPATWSGRASRTAPSYPAPSYPAPSERDRLHRAGELQDPREGQRALGPFPDLVLTPAAAAERQVGSRDRHTDLDHGTLRATIATHAQPPRSQHMAASERRRGSIGRWRRELSGNPACPVSPGVLRAKNPVSGEGKSWTEG